MKKLTVLILTLCLLFSVGCADGGTEKTDKLTVVATLFPQYDFCRALVGDRAEVILLLPPGMESHSFEPSMADMRTIYGADLFLFTGPAMEPWADKIAGSLPDSVTVTDVSVGIEKIEHDHGDHDHEHEHGHDHEEEEMDPHVWTDPLNACVMTENILASLCVRDPDNGAFYRQNAEKYLNELRGLDETFRQIVLSGETNWVCHGGRFSMAYFAKRYGLSVTAAFDSCSSQAEPSAARVMEMIEEVKKQKTKVVFYEELNEPRIARVIAEESGAQMLLLHTCHNVSKDELNRGETYLSLMKQNAEHLKTALGVE